MYYITRLDRNAVHEYLAEGGRYYTSHIDCGAWSCRSKADADSMLASLNPEQQGVIVNLSKDQVRGIVKEKARQALERLGVVPGATVYTTVDHVSRSGMMRHISCYVVNDGRIVNITRTVSDLIGWPQHKDRNGLMVSGCGMDMCFHVVYTLGRCMFPGGTKEPHGTRNGQPDTDGGYALKMERM